MQGGGLFRRPYVGLVIVGGWGRGLLANARAQRIEHIPASGADLYACGVPLAETQFREVFAAYQAELDELPPPADRTEWEMKRRFAAAQRLAVLTGTHPRAFPDVGEADQAWEWYAASNPYAAAELPRIHGMPVSPDWLADPVPLLARAVHHTPSR